MSVLYDKDKVGSIILSTYRSGTHFLHDCIIDMLPLSVGYGEICNDQSIRQLKELSIKSSRYKVCILNCVSPKFKLYSELSLLQDWHVIRLTHENKIKHFISHWFWKLNQESERMNDSGKYKHHGTPADVYSNSLKEPVILDIESVIVWLQEQLIIHHLPIDTSLDYSNLKNLSTSNIRWNPNLYDNISLQDLFINHQEIYDLLSNFKISIC